MPTTEHTINDALAEVLRGTRLAWARRGVVRSENTRAFKGNAKRPDVLVAEPNVSPVVIETEVSPAATVEADAVDRLGECLRSTGSPVLSSIAVCLPRRMRDLADEGLRESLSNATDLRMALYTGSSPDSFSRLPLKGWLRGAISDLSSLIQSASVPPAVVEEAADRFVDGISEAAARLSEIASERPGVMERICDELKQQEGEQTLRMAATILIDALIFQDRLARGPGELAEIETCDELRGSSGRIGKSALLGAWRRILKINYWPIFDIARRILEVIPARHSGALLEGLWATANRLLENHLTRSHDLTGAVFQRLIADRKFLAAFYTTPASAELLVGLATRPDKSPAGGSWGDVDHVGALRIADFACGTGTLLSTAYRRISQLHELGGGDAGALHSDMMATGLVGCDVLPAAAHLTASMLAGVHPTAIYTGSSIMTLPYGRQPDGSVALGSLDWLDPQGELLVLSITSTAATDMSSGETRTEEDVSRDLHHSSFDLVIMNPPFTRNTGHEGEKVGVSNPMFAAFKADEETQKAMALETKRLTKGTSAHGNAGEASIFLVLANQKLSERGTLAMVMPLSLVSGDAWEKSRQLLRDSYRDLIVVSIAGSGSTELSFSADTDMGDCLVVGRKHSTKKRRATFAILNEPPSLPLVGATAARLIRRLASAGRLRKLEDGPLGGTALSFGDDTIGYAVDAPLPSSGGWNMARVSDVSLAQAAHQLCEEGRIWLPGMDEADAVSIPVACVADIGRIGPYHADVSWNTPQGKVRGPFEIVRIPPGSVPTYPVLWKHDAVRERSMEFGAESEGIVRQGSNATEDQIIRRKAEQVWATASHCHFNVNFRFNSQSTAMQYTRRPTIGGRAWMSIGLGSEKQEKALVAWANSSLGLLLYWWHANKEQSGRGNIGKNALHSLRVLDVTALPAERIDAAAAIFDDMRSREMLPLNEMDADPARQELDERLASEVLLMDAQHASSDAPLGVLRRKLAQEPSVVGHKSS